MSSELKDAIGIYAQSADKSVAQVVREAIATAIGYDLVEERNGQTERRGRPKVYETREARRQASRARAKARRELRKRLVEEHKRQEATAAMQKFAESVAKLPA